MKEVFEKLSCENLTAEDSTDGKNPTESKNSEAVESPLDIPALENSTRPGEDDDSSRQGGDDTTPRPGELVKGLRPGEVDDSSRENMSLSESLVNEEMPFHMKGSSYSRSPLTPTSECSSYGTSPLSDVDILASSASTTNPIPIPAVPGPRD